MNWRRWIRPALIVTLLVAIAAILIERGGIERDIAGRVAAELAADGQVWAGVTVSARDVTITGVAPAVDAQQAAVVAAEKVRGVRAVADGSGLLPIASPYVWSAHRSGRTVTLSGSVPSEGVRAAVLASARRALPEAEIVDRQALARGAPLTFTAATAFALSRLPAFADAVVTLRDSTLTASGTAADAGSFAGLKEAFVGDLPPSVELGPVEILPARADPFVWSANLDRESVTVAGFVPSEVVHEALAGSLKATLGGLPVVDNVAVASGEPPGFAEAATFAISALGHLRRGGVTLDGLALDIAGTAKSVEDYEALLASLAGSLPEGMKVVATDVAPAAVADYGWRGEVADGKVVLSGYVPSRDRHSELVAMARTLFAGRNVEDRVRIAAGEPRMDWVGAVKFAMAQLAKLSRGAVTITDTDYAIEGEAADADSYLAIVDANSRTLPASLRLAKAAVIPPSSRPIDS